MAVSISASDLSDQVDIVDRIAGRLIETDGPIALSDLQRLVSTAVRLYAVACEREGVELPPLVPGISTTEAVRLSVALARSQDLSPFDLALWFAQIKPAHSAYGE